MKDYKFTPPTKFKMLNWIINIILRIIEITSIIFIIQLSILNFVGGVNL